jgi:osmoprotectant transport system ATP-binding protein
VDDLTLEIPAGRTCVLIGPSGCGKTTTLKMINRLVEPTRGRISINGRDVSRADPVQLRRGIGYVIQQVGLFPHMTIAENVATVPRLSAWSPARIEARVHEMLGLVGLDPATYARRYPRELSGGERQRVGVARALAGDPPVMLMDEPFGAVDPITRTRLQAQFLEVFRRLAKTIVFVTHDVDEAIRMGDVLAVLRGGHLVQQGPPEEVLRRPADAFVEDFLGADRALKRLGLVRVREAMTAAPAADVPPAPLVAADATLRDALGLLLAPGPGLLAVVDGEGRPVGVISLGAVRRRLG